MIDTITSDNELLMLANENSEEAKEILLKRHSNIIDILIIKYSSIFFKLEIDKQEVYAEALYAFTDALNSYNTEKNASFPTFFTLCLQRRIGKIIRKHNTEKSKFDKKVYSLDYVSDSLGVPLIDIIKSENINDPLIKITEEESYKEFNDLVKNKLSEMEYVVYEYMLDNLNYNEIALLLNKNPKQIDNAIQRIKIKIKEILNSNI